jgi:hypothetical protein
MNEDHSINEKYVKEVLKKFFDTSYSWGKYSIDLPTNYFGWNSSKHYFKDDTLIHFTKYENGISIIKNETLRIYNFCKSNDKSELENILSPFAGDFLDLLKVDSGIVSFCELSEINNNEMWYNYANESKGICIEFEISNDRTNWNEFYLFKVVYGNDMFDNFYTEHKKFLIENGIEKINVRLNQFIPIIKNQSWSKEKEVRLYCGEGWWFQNSKIETDKTKFIELKLNSHDIPSVPLLKIRKVHIGKAIDENNKNIIIDLLKEKKIKFQFH